MFINRRFFRVASQKMGPSPSAMRRRCKPRVDGLEDRSLLSAVAGTPALHTAQVHTAGNPVANATDRHALQANGTFVGFPTRFVIANPFGTVVKFPGGSVHAKPRRTHVVFPGGFVFSSPGRTVVKYPGGFLSFP